MGGLIKILDRLERLEGAPKPSSVEKEPSRCRWDGEAHRELMPCDGLQRVFDVRNMLSSHYIFPYGPTAGGRLQPPIQVGWIIRCCPFCREDLRPVPGTGHMPTTPGPIPGDK